MTDRTLGYLPTVIENLNRVENEQYDNIIKAAELMRDAIKNDRLINVYGGGGHTTLPVGEMFFRSGGLANINPIMATGLSVFNQALNYLELERTENFGSAIMKYYGLKQGDLLIVFHNIGITEAFGLSLHIALTAKDDHIRFLQHPSSASTASIIHIRRHMALTFGLQGT